MSQKTSKHEQSISSQTISLRLDDVLKVGLGFVALISALLLLVIIVFLGFEAWPALIVSETNTSGVFSFFNHDGWFPLEGKLGLLPMLWASLAVMVGSVLLAAPFGFLCAIFATFYAPPLLARAYFSMVSLLAGIPSVVYGLWGLTVLVPLVAEWQPPGASLFSAIIVLALMILPTVALTSRSAIAAVPPSLIQGAAALGISLKGIVLGVVFPAARKGVVSGVLLAVARALGETMAVLMVAGNVVNTPTGLFEPVRVLTANIALEMAYATELHRSGLFVSGLLLMLLVLAIAWIAVRISREPAHG